MESRLISAIPALVLLLSITRCAGACPASKQDREEVSSWGAAVLNAALAGGKQLEAPTDYVTVLR